MSDDLNDDLRENEELDPDALDLDDDEADHEDGTVSAEKLAEEEEAEDEDEDEDDLLLMDEEESY